MNPPSDETTSTVAYYDAHAAEFCENTVSLDMSELYAPFLRDKGYSMPGAAPGEIHLHSCGKAIT
jgi:hypothetical protein